MARQNVLLRGGWRYVKTIGGAEDQKYHNPWDLALRPDGVMAVLCRQQKNWTKIILNTFEDEEYLGEFGLETTAFTNFATSAQRGGGSSFMGGPPHRSYLGSGGNSSSGASS